MTVTLTALHNDTDFHIGLKLVAGKSGLLGTITHNRVQKPGLALAGFTEAVRPQCIQVIGRTEMAYLSSLNKPECRAAIDGFLATELGAVIVTGSQTPPSHLLTSADAKGVPVFVSEHLSDELINRVHRFLDEELSPETTLHGVAIDVFGVGVFISGPSGVGKSECALDLILRGHRLVADDAVVVKQIEGRIRAMGSPLIRHHMEIRGLGIINIKDLYGAAAVRERKFLELIVEMCPWNPDTVWDRTGLDGRSETLLDIALPKIDLPIRPGRPVASIVEVAARNHLLHKQGHNSAIAFKETLERHLEEAARNYEPG